MTSMSKLIATARYPMHHVLVLMPLGLFMPMPPSIPNIMRKPIRA